MRIRKVENGFLVAFNPDMRRSSGDGCYFDAEYAALTTLDIQRVIDDYMARKGINYPRAV